MIVGAIHELPLLSFATPPQRLLVRREALHQ
jgi:hypothetical protein